MGELAEQGEPITLEALVGKTGASAAAINAATITLRRTFGFPRLPFRIVKAEKGKWVFVPVRKPPWVKLLTPRQLAYREKTQARQRLGEKVRAKAAELVNTPGITKVELAQGVRSSLPSESIPNATMNFWLKSVPGYQQLPRGGSQLSGLRRSRVQPVMLAISELAAAGNEISLESLSSKTGFDERSVSAKVGKLRRAFNLPHLPFRIEQNRRTKEWRFQRTDNVGLVQTVVTKLAAIGKPASLEDISRATRLSRTDVSSALHQLRETSRLAPLPSPAPAKPAAKIDKPRGKPPLKQKAPSRAMPAVTEQALATPSQPKREPQPTVAGSEKWRQLVRAGSRPLAQGQKQEVPTAPAPRIQETTTRKTKLAATPAEQWEQTAEENPHASIADLHAMLKSRWPGVRWANVNPGATAIAEAQKRGRGKKKE